MALEDVGMCFACGPNNPIGLKLSFELGEGGRYTARFMPGVQHQGYDGIMHGGIMSTLLDEAMAKLVFALGHQAVTADLRVRFRKPARVGRELVITGWITSEARRLIDCAAEARDADGILVAEATGRMMKVALPGE